MVGSTLKVVVTAENGNTFESDETAAVTVLKELSLEAVEGGAIDDNSQTYNILIAYFSEPVDDINPADIEIREVSTDQLFSVESVVMSSDGMKATITLANSSAAGASVTGLEPNVDYNMIVTTEDDIASKEFSIPATMAGAMILNYDADKDTITAQNYVKNGVGAYGWSNDQTFKLPDDIVLDYAGILGETATIKYDKNHTVLSFVPLRGEKVILGAFKEVVDGTNFYLQDMLTEEKYYTTTGTGAIPASLKHVYGNAVNNDVAFSTAGAMTNTDEYAYGKLVLNTDGSIKNFLCLPETAKGRTSWSGNVLVSEVSGTSIIGQNKQEQSLDKYTILKDGESIEIDDIEKDDVVYYSTTLKLAEVYDNVEVGELEAVYDNAGFKFDGKNRDGSTARYLDGTTAKSVDTDYLKALDAAGGDITVIFNRKGEVMWVLGETAEVVTNKSDLILTKKGDGYAGTTTGVIALTGFDGTDTVSEQILISNLKKLTIGSVSYTSTNGKFATITSTNPGTVNWAATDWGTASSGEAIDYVGTASNGTAVTTKVGGTTAPILNLSTDLAVKQKVTITKDDKGNVIELAVPAGVGLTAGTAATATKFDGNLGKDFKAGYKTLQVNGGTGSVLNIPGSAKVYIVAKGPAVSKVSYSEFEKTVANANIGNITVYSSGSNVTDIVIDNQKGTTFSDDTDGSTTVEGVVKDMKLLDGVVNYITVETKDGEVTYDTFGTDTTNLKTAYDQGTIVDITVLKDGETVTSVVGDGETVACTSAVYGVSTTTPGSLYVQSTAASAAKLSKKDLTSDALIVKVENDAVSVISLSDLKALALTKQVVISTEVNNSAKVDTIVATATNRAAVGAYDATLATTTATTSYGAAVSALMNSLNTTATLYDSNAGAVVAATNATVNSVNGATAAAIMGQYKSTKSALADLKVLHDDIVAADGTATTLQNAAWPTATMGTFYTALETEYKRADKYQIASISAPASIAKATGPASTNYTLTEAQTAFASLSMPTSVHVLMANGTEADITVKYGAVTLGSGATDKIDVAAATAGDAAFLSGVLANQSIATAGNVTVTLTPVAKAGSAADIYSLPTGVTSVTVTLE